MEADWAAEIGPRLDHIDADWPGFIDLRSHPRGVERIAEARDSSALEQALAMLNGRDSPVFTCKCDRWTLSAEEIDPSEYDAGAGSAVCGVAAYVDLVARDRSLFRSFERHEGWARNVVLQLRRLPLPNGRLDLVIRAAIAGDEAGFGMTLYAAGCGADASRAESAWEEILRAGATVTMREAPQPSGE